MKMEKELKDYLHFYFGCKIGDSTNSNFIVCDSMGIYFYEYILNSPRKKDFKLILRPLSDMTEEEKARGDIHSSPPYTPDEFKYLLKQGFDLFGLIESGLAIDKTKLNQLSK